jgi:hypothetical protein
MHYLCRRGERGGAGLSRGAALPGVRHRLIHGHYNNKINYKSLQWEMLPNACVANCFICDGACFPKPYMRAPKQNLLEGQHLLSVCCSWLPAGKGVPSCPLLAGLHGQRVSLGVGRGDGGQGVQDRVAHIHLTLPPSFSMGGTLLVAD